MDTRERPGKKQPSQQSVPALFVPANLMMLAVLALVAVSLSSSPLRVFYVASGSMEPAMPTGSLIVVKTNPARLPEPGDIITFEQENIFITHRITGIGHDDTIYFITKGDANASQDREPVRMDQVTGKVVVISPPALAPALRYIRTQARPPQ